MFKLALNAGHGYATPGKRCLKSIDPNETREYVLNKRICDKIESRLKSYDGISVLRIDDGSDASIRARANKANAFKADFYLAIHHNAGINGKNGGGIEAYVYLKTDTATRVWQTELYQSAVAKTGLRGNRSNPIKSADFGELRETDMPAVLMECGFMDSTVDTPIILTEDYADKAADAFAEVIIRRAGLKSKAPSHQSQPTAAKKSADEVAREVIKGLWGNGADRKTQLTVAGYDYTAVQSKVNALLGGKTTAAKPVLKSNEQVAREVIKGLWGNGADRKNRLAAAGYNYSAVQGEVNRILK